MMTVGSPSYGQPWSNEEKEKRRKGTGPMKRDQGSRITLILALILVLVRPWKHQRTVSPHVRPDGALEKYCRIGNEVLHAPSV